jgi:hypothetical protein
MPGVYLALASARCLRWTLRSHEIGVKASPEVVSKSAFRLADGLQEVYPTTRRAATQLGIAGGAESHYFLD